MSLHQEITKEAASYPPRLLALGDTAPDTFFVRGVIPRSDFSVAIVGCRAASGEGMKAAESMAFDLAKQGVRIVSGGALGIDGAAHRGALRAGGPVVIVQAGGLEHVYPKRHRALFDQVAKHGAVLSTYPSHETAKRWQFVERNKWIAGLADIVVVIECSLASGSLHTARAARSFGRKLGAKPGSKGCEMLLADGAFVAETADDVSKAMQGLARFAQNELPPVGSKELQVLHALKLEEPFDCVSLSRHIDLDVRTTLRALTELELAGLALALPGQSYVLSQGANALIKKAA